MLTQSPSGVLRAQSRMWSMAALAADAALEAPRASMMAAPRFCTVGMNSSVSQELSTSELAGLPATLAWLMSGTCVLEWLPQMVMRVTSDTGAPPLRGSWLRDRLLSRQSIAVDWA